LTALVADLAVVAAGRAGAAVLSRVGARVSRSTVLRVLMATPLPDVAVPAVLSVDDFALRRGRRYATLLIDAVTHRRVDVLPDRKAETLAAWLREHPGVQVVCRDGSASYAEAIRTGAPQAVQVSDRWHLWANLAKAVEKTVIAHSGCWRDGPIRPDQPLDERTRERHRAVHALLDQGHGLLECARRLGWALNTVKRYARAVSAEDLKRPPRYRETLVDAFRDRLRRRRAEQPGVPVTRLLAEIRELGRNRTIGDRRRHQHPQHSAARDPSTHPGQHSRTGTARSHDGQISDQSGQRPGPPRPPLGQRRHLFTKRPPRTGQHPTDQAPDSQLHDDRTPADRKISQSPLVIGMHPCAELPAIRASRRSR
jgi:hypothetical protein